MRRLPLSLLTPITLLCAPLLVAPTTVQAQMQVMLCSKKGCVDSSLGVEPNSSEMESIFAKAAEFLKRKRENWFDDWAASSVSNYAQSCLALIPGGRIAPLSQSIIRNKEFAEVFKTEKYKDMEPAWLPSAPQRGEFCKDLAENGFVITCEGLMNNSPVQDELKRFPLAVTLVKNGTPARLSSYAKCSFGRAQIDSTNVEIREFKDISIMMRDGLTGKADPASHFVEIELPEDFKPKTPFQQDEKLYYLPHGYVVVTANGIKDNQGQDLKVTSKLVVLP